MTAPSVDLSALDALAEAATAGPWEADDDAWVLATDDERGFVCQSFDGLRPSKTDETIAHANAALIVALRNAWPAIKAEIEALRGENEKKRERIRSGLLAAGAVSALPGTEAERIVAGIIAALGATS